MKVSATLAIVFTAVPLAVSAAGLDMHRNDEWRSVPVDRVRLEGPLGRRIALTAANNLMKIDLERDFFKPFREKRSRGGFIGLGKLLDGAAYLARHTGFQDVVERKREIARVLADTQDADGYIGYFAPEARMRRLWDLHETGFILQGLVSDWELFGERRSLEAARRAADYVMRRWPEMEDGWEFHDITDRETTLGLAHGFIRLAAATGDMKYLDFAKNERALMDWNAPIVLGRSGMIYGQAYGFLGTALEQLELYGREANPKLLRTSFRALEHMTRRDGLLIDGTGGIAECWTDDQDGEGSVGETCLIAFQFLFYDRMLRLGQGDAAQLGDLMERLALNALPAAQSRDGRRLRYYTPLNGVRGYFYTDAYCCPNNFRRAMGRLPGYVYYEKDGAILANIFETSSARLDVGTAKVSVRCETDYPASGRIAYTLDPERPAQFAFMFRLPRWCKAPRVEVNGKAVTYPCRPGEMLSLPRIWKKGDRISIDLPMEIRCIKGRKRQSGRFTVMRGPLLYALDTRRVQKFAKEHPLDAATVLMLDPAQLEFKAGADGGRSAFCGTAIATRCTVRDYDRRIGPDCPEILLTEFADEDDTLTYFRTPYPESPLLVDDELLGTTK
ncbi:MAG: glycoside hydrolase family 127 protein [Kiritimatiellae bacterium]|nr:glycoside hydrolase family 127 protein [Kiritimatiellia bacterium]